MEAVGIIMECNPFHKGHEYILNEIKKEYGNHHIAAVMSGDFVQRGEPAILTKSRRTQILMDQGVDLVLELPVRLSLGNAKTFAYGSVSLLNSLPAVNTLIFGSESGNIKELKELALSCLGIENTEEYKNTIKENLKTGQSYAKAVSSAISSARKTPSQSPGSPLIDTRLLSSPNNLLGVEYIKALTVLSSHVKPVTFKRTKGYSAKEVRKFMCRNESDGFTSQDTEDSVLSSIPKAAYEIINNPKLYPVTSDDFSLLLYEKLLSLSKEELSLFEDITPDLASSIKNNLAYYKSFDQFALMIKRKNYTLSRIKRGLFKVLLGIKKHDPISEINSAGDGFLKYSDIPVRVLGMKKNAACLLKNVKAPVITTGASVNRYNNENNNFLLKESIHASMIYRQAAIIKFGEEIPDEYHSYPVFME